MSSTKTKLQNAGGKSTGTISRPSVRKRSENKSTDRKKDEKEATKVNIKTSSSRVSTKTGIEDGVRKKPLTTANKEIPKVLRNTISNKPQIKKIAKSKAEEPVTPASSRISKTQFFPSKKIMYANALKEEGISAKTTTSRKIVKKPIKKPISSENHKPGENVDASSDTSSTSERPRTATLRKGSIVNNNIVGPDVPIKAKVPKTCSLELVEQPQEESPTEDKYEDDFDSYESDFEQYNSSDSTATNMNLSELSSPSNSSTSTSDNELTEPKSAQKRSNSAGTDDERKMDSGNYEMPEYKHKQILDNIKESIEKENSIIVNHHNNLGSLSDEGFEDGKVSLQFINFLGAHQKNQRRKSIQKRRKRGEELLNMIRLDTFSFTLFDLPPVPYEDFIRNFGKRNTLQISTQTGDDHIDEETQTTEQLLETKWTQFPTNFQKFDENQENLYQLYKCNYLGVGGDSLPNQTLEINHNENHLERFLLSAGGLILNLQSEAFIDESTKITTSDVPFSKGVRHYDTQSWSYLTNRGIVMATFWPSVAPTKILTVHGRRENDLKSLVCMWSLYNTKEPESCFAAFGEITCCTSGIDSPDLIFAGFQDGTISVWDTKESPMHHLGSEKDDEICPTIRTPTYTTQVTFGHSCKVVSLHSLADKSEFDSFFGSNKSEEICSLDENGDVIIWGVIVRDESNVRTLHDQGLAHWGAVILVMNTKIILSEMYPEIDNFKCTDLAINNLDPSHLYVSTNYGVIIHCLTSGGKAAIKKFLPDSQSQANCLEVCPFSSQHFMAGFDNGNIEIYNRLIENPLIVMSDKECSVGKNRVDSIEWSRNKPLTFYTKDARNTIHVWDLKVSDMFPTYSVPLKERIVCMTLSTSASRNIDSTKEETYMIIGTESGSVYLHLLNPDHGQQSLKEYEEDKSKLLKYIDRYA